MGKRIILQLKLKLLKGKEFVFAVSYLKSFQQIYFLKLNLPRLLGFHQMVIFHAITPEPINSSSLYHAANCPGVTPLCAFSKVI